MQQNYDFPGITIISIDRPCPPYMAPEFTFTMKNSNDSFEGCVKVECDIYAVTITRYYIHGWFQCRASFPPLDYKKCLLCCSDVAHAHVLTKYIGNKGGFPIFEVDEDMTNAVWTICHDYANHRITPHVVIIQKYVRGYLSRRRYNFNMNRVLVVKEILALPKGAIVSTFPGGQDYVHILTSWI